ncbi:major capsid protein [Pleomorphomonas carboxyditropha]|uniref:Major capsid protein E n=1 Tax=Pleomorphomonas carboxyditropha TaxID=2023338 RepID=A0A2G9X166_9HYPH|nr:major capsid protein [Pleomorphomonas carboxyditropha]PIP00675.1 hypothetical protein CJ014_00800 [Pleomorphomonas carboxyditropha]
MTAFADIVKDPAFSLMERTNSIIDTQYVPHEISDWLNWDTDGIPFRSVSIEEQNGSISLIETQPLKAPAPKIEGDSRVIRTLNIPRYPVEVSVDAAEVDGVRKVGSDNEVEYVVDRLKAKELKARKSHDATLEFARAGAVSGLIRDKNGATIYDLYSELGVARIDRTIDFSNSATDIVDELSDIRAQAEDELGGYLINGWIWLQSGTVNKKTTTHNSVRESFKYFQTSFAASDKTKGFTICDDIQVRNYRKGKLNGQSFIDEGDSFLLPLVDDFYHTRFAPSLSFPNTPGLPLYVIPGGVDKYGQVFDELVESHHISWISRPRAIIRIRAA